MDSIVIDAQKHLLNKSTTDILRQAYIIAKKLQIRDFEIWINNELKGYNENTDVPEYRTVCGNIKYLDSHRGWLSLIIEDANTYNHFTKISARQSIPMLEHLINTVKSGGNIIENLPDSFNELIEDNDIPTKYIREISPSSIVGVIETVKSIVTEWILKLEEDGIVGVNMKFTDEEIKIAGEKNYTVNNFYGDVSSSQIQQNNNRSSQIINNDLDIDKIAKVLELINTHKKDILGSLDNSKDKDFEKELNAVNNEITKHKPSKELLVQSLHTIRNILEGITGNIIAAGILYQLGLLFK